MAPSTSIRQIVAQPITPASFKPYGQVILASVDGKPYNQEDAQLQLDQGIPRFYIMRLHHRGRTFSHITRHKRCTQCLGALEGKAWFLGVASPGESHAPNLDTLRAFQIPGNCFVKLHVGTWHAGPYFDQDVVDFYNLELSDTNITDHETCNLMDQYGVEFEIVV